MRRLLRVVAIALWTVAAFWAWPLLLVGIFEFIIYGQRTWNWPPLTKLIPDETLWTVIVFGSFGVGTIIVTVAALILGMRGWLPGTSRNDRGQQGFPITPVSKSD